MKRRYGAHTCLYGDANSALLNTGIDAHVGGSARSALWHGIPGGGSNDFMSNGASKGIALERYLMILDIRRRYGRCDDQLV